MASIRELKKDINVLSYHLLAKCYAIKNYGPGMDDQKFEETIKKIVYLRNDLINRVNHPETDGESLTIKEHYGNIKEDLFELMNSFEELKTDRF